MARCAVLLLAGIGSSAVLAQEETGKWNLAEGIDIQAEASATVSSGKLAPLWLSANRHGEVSPFGNSAYERIGMFRSASVDSARTWRVGYGVDVTLNQHAQSKLFIHQAYAQIGYKKTTLTIGSRERQVELRNNELTSGGLSLGINARPIPMAMLDIEDIKLTSWWKMNLRGGYGMTTDGDWQEKWVECTTRKHHVSNILYHEKAFFWKFGKLDRFPVTFDFGLQFMTQFGGKSYQAHSVGDYSGLPTQESAEDLKAFWDALILVGSSDTADGLEKNSAGNTVGSYNMRLTYHGRDYDYSDFVEKWSASLYFERMFEDASNLTSQYGIYDHLLGVEVNLPRNPWISNVVVEHLSTKDQAGAVFFDGSTDMKDRFAGRDDYYNHSFYVGWQNYGMSLGTPLLMSPIYNADHELRFKSNRTQAWHFALAGSPLPELKWRAMYTMTKDWGTYDVPFDDIVRQHHMLIEATYAPRWMKGVSTTFGLAKSWGSIIGTTSGCQLSVRYNIYK